MTSTVFFYRVFARCFHNRHEYHGFRGLYDQLCHGAAGVVVVLRLRCPRRTGPVHFAGAEQNHCKSELYHTRDAPPIFSPKPPIVFVVVVSCAPHDTFQVPLCCSSAWTRHHTDTVCALLLPFMDTSQPALVYSNALPSLLAANLAFVSVLPHTWPPPSANPWTPLRYALPTLSWYEHPMALARCAMLQYHAVPCLVSRPCSWRLLCTTLGGKRRAG